MPAKFGTIGMSAIYNGSNKIGKVYKGTELYYQSFVYDPVVALIERTIENIDTELTNETTTIGVSAFQNCTSLKSIEFPNAITTIEKYAFENCTSLTNIQFPESLNTIGVGAFQNCTSLNNLVIPSKMYELGSSAFSGCSNLTTMTFQRTYAPSMTDASAISTATTTIYVPSGSKSYYEGATTWKDLLTRETNPVTFIEYN